MLGHAEGCCWGEILGLSNLNPCSGPQASRLHLLLKQIVHLFFCVVSETSLSFRRGSAFVIAVCCIRTTKKILYNEDHQCFFLKEMWKYGMFVGIVSIQSLLI